MLDTDYFARPRSPLLGRVRAGVSSAKLILGIVYVLHHCSGFPIPCPFEDNGTVGWLHVCYNIIEERFYINTIHPTSLCGIHSTLLL